MIWRVDVCLTMHFKLLGKIAIHSQIAHSARHEVHRNGTRISYKTAVPVSMLGKWLKLPHHERNVQTKWFLSPNIDKRVSTSSFGTNRSHSKWHLNLIGNRSLDAWCRNASEAPNYFLLLWRFEAERRDKLRQSDLYNGCQWSGYDLVNLAW